jgi:hypothetical protein
VAVVNNGSRAAAWATVLADAALPEQLSQMPADLLVVIVTLFGYSAAVLESQEWHSVQFRVISDQLLLKGESY